MDNEYLESERSDKAHKEVVGTDSYYVESLVLGRILDAISKKQWGTLHALTSPVWRAATMSNADPSQLELLFPATDIATWEIQEVVKGLFPMFPGLRWSSVDVRRSDGSAYSMQIILETVGSTLYFNPISAMRTFDVGAPISV